MCFFFISSFFLLTYHLSSSYKHPPAHSRATTTPLPRSKRELEGCFLPSPAHHTPMALLAPQQCRSQPPLNRGFFFKFTILFIDLGEGYTTLTTGMPTSIDIWIAAARHLSQTFCPYFFIFLSTKKAVNNKLSNIKTNLSIRTVCFQVRATYTKKPIFLLNSA